jgi:subtilisin family serine protease
MSGGVAVVIYATSPNRLTDYTYSGTSIPVMMISYADGMILVGSYVGQYGQVTALDGYGYMFGTSMATPHVAGAAASIWRQCPNCRNRHVENCLVGTAMDLGSYGKDALYGSGMVQSQNAYNCLQRSGCC